MGGYYGRIESPLGVLVVLGEADAVTGLYFPWHRGWSGLRSGFVRHDEKFAQVREQLTEYFSGQRQQFDLPLSFSGTPFRQSVWRELQKIPFGETITYAELARRIGQPSASRAVGHANGKNPIPIIVPCHRVIATTGKLTGYAGGIDKKRWLIDFEQAQTSATISARRSPE